MEFMNPKGEKFNHGQKVMGSLFIMKENDKARKKREGFSDEP